MSKEEYYTGDRVYYQQPPSNGNTQVVVEKRREEEMGCCTWILTALFIILLIILAICIILFFTIDPNTPSSRRVVLASNSGAYVRAPPAHHRDLESAAYVLTAIEKDSVKACILDAAYFGDDSATAFHREHLPTARHFNIEAVVEASPTERRAPGHPFKFEQYARSLGIDDDCHVIIYDHADDDNSVKAATFVWWLFKLYGHERVSVLDGGLREWRRLSDDSDDFGVESGASSAGAPGDFTAYWNPAYIANYDDVTRSLQTERPQLVDTRPKADFDGQSQHPLSAHAGRIRGAKNVPLSDVLDDDGAFSQTSRIDAAFSNQGVSGARPSIVYCNSGMQASVVFFAMKQRNWSAQIYSGGWIEWSHKAPASLKTP